MDYGQYSLAMTERELMNCSGTNKLMRLSIAYRPDGNSNGLPVKIDSLTVRWKNWALIAN